MTCIFSDMYGNSSETLDDLCEQNTTIDDLGDLAMAINDIFAKEQKVKDQRVILAAVNRIRVSKFLECNF